MTNEELIRRTFHLAKIAEGNTWPNPLVGAVIVKDGRIIGEGYHHKAGMVHAEVDAIKNATESTEGATIYVNLEPCCHTNKRTPPCAQRLIQEKFKKVVICNLDPNPHVFGEGVKILKAAGIEVEHGILKEAGEELNEVFFTAQRNKRPFMHLKMAATLDGKTALPSGESKWITNEDSRARVQVLRAQSQAIMVGAETVRKDNPKLNVRLANYEGEQPYRVVITKSGKLPATHHLFTDELKARTLIYTQTPLSFDFPSEQVVQVANLQEVMTDLFNRKIISVFLEGGATLATAMMKEKLIDRVSIFLNPSFLGCGTSLLGDLGIDKLAERPFLKQVTTQMIGDDLYLTGRLS